MSPGAPSLRPGPPGFDLAKLAARPSRYFEIRDLVESTYSRQEECVRGLRREEAIEELCEIGLLILDLEIPSVLFRGNLWDSPINMVPFALLEVDMEPFLIYL